MNKPGKPPAPSSRSGSLFVKKEVYHNVRNQGYLLCLGFRDSAALGIRLIKHEVDGEDSCFLLRSVFKLSTYTIHDWLLLVSDLKSGQTHCDKLYVICICGLC